MKYSSVSTAVVISSCRVSSVGKYCPIRYKTLFFTHREYPVDGHIEGLANTQEIGGDQQDVDDERDHDHKHEERGGRVHGGSGQSHADDAQHLRVKRERGIGMYVICKVYSKKI